MGDFDRVDNSAKPKENKKLVIVVLLGVALLGLVAMQLTKKGPAPAMAGVPDSGAAVSAIAKAETPEQVLLALQNDPTANLLQEGGTHESFKKLPRNPFHMSDDWRMSLTKTVEVVAPRVEAPIDTTPQPTRVQPVPLKIEDYKLGMVLRQGNTMTAIINGKQVTVGMVVDKVRVLDIREGVGVTLQHVDFPDGAKVDISLSGGKHN